MICSGHVFSRSAWRGVGQQSCEQDPTEGRQIYAVYMAILLSVTTVSSLMVKALSEEQRHGVRILLRTGLLARVGIKMKLLPPLPLVWDTGGTWEKLGAGKVEELCEITWRRKGSTEGGERWASPHLGTSI